MMLKLYFRVCYCFILLFSLVFILWGAVDSINQHPEVARLRPVQAKILRSEVQPIRESMVRAWENPFAQEHQKPQHTQSQPSKGKQAKAQDKVLFFEPMIEYEYSVEGHPYRSQTLGTVMYRMNSEGEAKRFLAPYGKGQTVMAYVDGQSPQDARLFWGVTPRPYWILVATFLLQMGLCWVWVYYQPWVSPPQLAPKPQSEGFDTVLHPSVKPLWGLFATQWMMVLAVLILMVLVYAQWVFSSTLSQMAILLLALGWGVFMVKILWPKLQRALWAFMLVKSVDFRISSPEVSGHNPLKVRWEGKALRNGTLQLLSLRLRLLGEVAPPPETVLMENHPVVRGDKLVVEGDIPIPLQGLSSPEGLEGELVLSFSMAYPGFRKSSQSQGMQNQAQWEISYPVAISPEQV